MYEICKEKIPISEAESILDECLRGFKSLAGKMFKHYDEDYIMNELYTSCKSWFLTKKLMQGSSVISDLSPLNSSEGHAAQEVVAHQEGEDGGGE